MTPRLLRLTLLSASLLASQGVRATDVVAATTPVALADGVVQIGSRSVRLPPGDWTLVHVKEFHPPMARDVDITTAWVVLLRDGRLGMAMQLSLPVADMRKDRRIPDNPCTARDGVLRGDYSHGESEMECLAVFGHHELQDVLQQRAPRIANWVRKRVPKVDDGIEVTYSHRDGRMLGRVAFYFPAQDFASDDDAARWAGAVRATFEPLVERKVAEVTLPPLPAAAQP
ncbi:MAG TPA: hypothetical protein VIP05_24905 [Burkholderiaceae bacterium]